MLFTTLAALIFAAAVSSMPAPATITSAAQASSIDSFGDTVVVTFNGTNSTRNYLTNMVVLVLDSMVKGDPTELPMGHTYKASENGHPAALVEMMAWRTITKVFYTDAGVPNLLAIDTVQAQAYFALDVTEGNADATPSILRGRVKLVEQRITELEIFINCGRGDHGFSFSPSELPGNYEILMSPPANRTKASRETLLAMGEAVFGKQPDFKVTWSKSCQFSELGWRPVDPGVWGNGSTSPVDCSWVSNSPRDPNARAGLVIDEELGFVVSSGTVQGKVYPYADIPQYIPDAMATEQAAMEVWYKKMQELDLIPLLAPIESTGDTMEVLQYYNNDLQAMQINVYLNGPNMTSAWV